MTGMEIIFIVSVLALLVMWVWFIVLGFHTSRLWTAGLIFLFPVLPFIFAYRFERKTRHAIYYLIGSLVFFGATMFSIKFATSVDFFSILSGKIERAMPRIDFSPKPEPVKKLNLPKPTYIPPPLSVEPDVEETPVVENAPKPVQQKTSGYKTIDIGSVGSSYVGKNVLIMTTSGAKRKGKLRSVTDSEIEIKETIGGGTATITIKKSKITKFQVSS